MLGATSVFTSDSEKEERSNARVTIKSMMSKGARFNERFNEADNEDSTEPGMLVRSNSSMSG